MCAPRLLAGQTGLEAGSAIRNSGSWHSLIIPRPLSLNQPWLPRTTLNPFSLHWLLPLC